MAYYWVQQWFALPLIPENPMGDEPSGGISPLTQSSKIQYRQTENQTTDRSRPEEGHQGPWIEPNPLPSAGPFHSQVTSLQSAQSPSHHFQHQFSPLSSQNAPGRVYGTGNTTGVIPEYAASSMNGRSELQQPQQLDHRRSSGSLTPAIVYQLQQNVQFAGQAGSTSIGGSQPYHHNTMPVQYGQGLSNSHGSRLGSFEGFPSSQIVSSNLSQHHYPGLQHAQQHVYYPAYYNTHGLFPGGLSQQSGLYGRRSSAPLMHGQYTQAPMSAQAYSPFSRTAASNAYNSSYGMPSSFVSPSGWSGITRHASESNLSTVPRGPPRKPKQSGHALWVGNLPPGTNILDLKDHFSRNATNDIESLFLISKSNCAFVNYKTEEACSAAMHRFHDSRFHGVRLVCRLRRSATPASGTPAGPSVVTSSSSEPEPSDPNSINPTSEINKEEEIKSGIDGAQEADAPPERHIAVEKYFIVKSLTLQDLELSVQTGVWATQSHNEEKFNQAYHEAENVYLIFSANKSGEYYGYAKMTSPILPDAEEIQRKHPSSWSETTVVEAPKAIPTPNTETAPKGHIIDDSARGTIFWEADRSDTEENGREAPHHISKHEPDSVTESDTPATWGKPFKIEWLSTSRLPFFRTRGLRNAWNANREVKIARDGTELETTVGRKLVQLFHRPGQELGGPAVAGSVASQIGLVGSYAAPPEARQHF